MKIQNLEIIHFSNEDPKLEITHFGKLIRDYCIPEIKIQNRFKKLNFHLKKDSAI